MAKNDPANIDFIFGDDEASKEVDPRVARVTPSAETEEPDYANDTPTRELWVGFHLTGDEDDPEMGLQFNIKDNVEPISEEESFSALDEALAIANNTLIADILEQDWEAGMAALVGRFHMLYHNQKTEDQGNLLIDSMIQELKEMKKSHE